jgi:hypothetical protein
MQTSARSELLPRLARLSGESFELLALDIFQYQAAHNPLYARYLQLLGRDPARIARLADVPFLPIQFFKSHVVKTGEWTEEAVFTSSGTTGQTPSRHYVRSVSHYLANTRRGFEQRYGAVDDWCVLALLPSYLERTGSSLVAMADHFIRGSRHGESGFFLHDYARLNDVLRACRDENKKTLLLGVSFALLEFAERYPEDLRGVTVMETGGMKGRRRELTRAELHAELTAAFQLDAIHSEYGMTELFSQAYAAGGTVFRPAPTLAVRAMDPYDPFAAVKAGRTGVLHMIDLANIDTCAFVATEDLGRVYADGTFEVLGRLDVAELRGCNLMIENQV